MSVMLNCDTIQMEAYNSIVSGSPVVIFNSHPQIPINIPYGQRFLQSNEKCVKEAIQKFQEERPTDSKDLIVFTDYSHFVPTSGFDRILTSPIGFIAERFPILLKDVTKMVLPNQITLNLFVGSFECVEYATRFLDIDTVLSICQEDASHHIRNSRIRHKWFKVDDICTTNIIPIAKLCSDIIHKCVTQDKLVLVHCQAGISRSVAVVIYYLMEHQAMNYEQAYECVKYARWMAKPNKAFEQQLKDVTFQNGGIISR